MENIASTEEKATPRLGTLLYRRIIFLPWSFFPERHVIIREIISTVFQFLIVVFNEMERNFFR